MPEIHIKLMMGKKKERNGEAKQSTVGVSCDHESDKQR